MANLKEAFQYAAQNPTSDFAKKLEALAGSGYLDQEAKKYGIDLTPFKPKVEQPSQMSRLGTALKDRVGTVTEQFKQIGDAQGAVETVAQVAQTPLRVAGALGGAVGDVVGAGLEATKIPEFVARPEVQQALSTTAGMIPGFSAIKQALSGVDTVTGGGIEKLKSIVTSPETQQQVSSAITKLEETQPEVAQTIKDVFNSFNLIVGGSAAKPVVKATVTGTKNAIEAVGDITKLVPDNLSQKAVDIISSDPSAKVETILKRSTPEEVDNFLNIAKQSSVSGEAKSVFEVVGDKLSDTTKILQTKLNEIGKAKSEIMQPLREGFSAFKKETTPFIQKLNSLKNSFTEIDAASKAKVQAIINDAKNVVTKQDADVLIDKVQDALYKGGVDMTIPSGSALDKQLRGILGEFNTALKNSLPKEYGQLNARYAQLIDSLDTINRSLGEVVEGVPVRGASLIKQYFSPAGSKAKEIFEFIKKETNGEVDLAKDATLAKFAGELYDDANVSSLLGGLKSVPTTVGGVATKIVEKLGGEMVSKAMRESTVRKAKIKALPKKEK